MALFGSFLPAPHTHQFVDTLIFLYMKGLQVVHIWRSFIYVGFVALEFSNFKCFRKSRKGDFKLALGCFLAITPRNVVIFVWNFYQ